MSEWSPDIARLQNFDDDEWLEVERNFGGRLLAYAARRIPDKEAREDVLQETLLGAVRGIADYDSMFTFEQYLFGICHNRTIDSLRKKRLPTVRIGESSDEAPALEVAAGLAESPSRIVRGRELERHGRELLGRVLRTWVHETWMLGEFTRLMVVEALFSGGWRNKDTWERFELRDETAVAGIKFRALKRLRELANERDPEGEVLQGLVASLEEGQVRLEFTVAETWREQRVACPARYWLGRHVVGNLPAGPAAFVDFHMTEMGCPWCQANLEDLRAIEEPDLAPLRERVQRSTLRYLHSRISGLDPK